MSQWPKGSLLVEHFYVKEWYHRGKRTDRGRFPHDALRVTGWATSTQTCLSEQVIQARQDEEKTRGLFWKDKSNHLKERLNTLGGSENDQGSVNCRTSIVGNMISMVRIYSVYHILGEKPLQSTADKKRRVLTVTSFWRLTLSLKYIRRE